MSTSGAARRPPRAGSGRAAATTSGGTRQRGGPPAPSGADEFNAGIAQLLKPVAELALGHGAKLPELVELLKLALAEAAQTGSPASVSESKVAVMTGVHRKDLRRIRLQGARARPRRSIAAETFARWMSDPRYLTKRGAPRVLPRSSEPGGDPNAVSFDSLVSAITTDVHPRAVLDELIRLGHVELDAADRAHLVASAYVPDRDRGEAFRFGIANAADHLAAINANLSGQPRRFLEQAIYADELSEQSAVEFNRESMLAWQRMFEQMMPRLRELFDADRRNGRPFTHRVRLGMYGFMQPLNDPESAQPEASSST